MKRGRDMTIKTPRGEIFIGANGKAKLIWNTNFVPRWNGKYSTAQETVDHAVLHGCEEFIPMQSGMLIKSGILGTHIGSGLVSWIAPYARRQYYKGRAPGTSDFGPLRGRFWFQRWKEIHAAPLIARVQREFGK